MIKKNVILIYMILIMVFVITGVSFAYFNVKKSTNDLSSVDKYYANNKKLLLLNGTLDSSGQLNKPGSQLVKIFTVKNMDKNPLSSYVVRLTNVVNTFTNINDLKYTITCETSRGSCNGITDPQTYPTSDAIILNASSLGKNETHTYTLTINYIETSSDQSIDMNKTIKGKIEISAS